MRPEVYEYAYEPYAPWLAAALAQVNQLPERNLDDKAMNRHARTVLRSIEAQGICAPSINRTGAGIIHILFVFGQRSAEFMVWRPGFVKILRWSPYETHRPYTVKGWPGGAARDAIRWVFPSAFSTDAAGMASETVMENR